MKAEAVVECIQDYQGKNDKGKTIRLKKGKQYYKTVGDKYVYLNHYDRPDQQLAWIPLEDYAALEGTYLK